MIVNNILLEFSLNGEQNSYSVRGSDTCQSSIDPISIEIPSTHLGKPVTSIGKWAFADCKSLKSIVIPDGVTSIGNQAFFRCTSLTSIVIPDSVTSIGDYVFENCTSLTSIVIPDGVTSIGNGAFKYCTSLTSIVIPYSVTSMGSSVFKYCSFLTIYAEASSKPYGWSDYWNLNLVNFHSCPVVWGYIV